MVTKKIKGVTFKNNLSSQKAILFRYNRYFLPEGTYLETDTIFKVVKTDNNQVYHPPS